MIARSRLAWVFSLSVAALAMGATFPGCPGSQALQQQIDSLSLRASDLTQQVQSLESQLKATNNELNQTRSLLTQVSNTVLAQRQALAQMDQALRALGAKRPATKPAGKRRRKR